MKGLWHGRSCELCPVMASELLVPGAHAEWRSDVVIVRGSAFGTASLALHA